jgi:hypothetical protein
MRDLFRIPRLAVPAWTKRTLTLGVAGVIVLSTLISPGVSSALAVFTMQKAAKISLGNTVTVTQAGTTDGTGGATFHTATILCPPGHQALDGGADSPAIAGTSPDGYTWLTSSAPVNSGGRSVGWYVELIDGTSSPTAFTAYAVCAP